MACSCAKNYLIFLIKNLECFTVLIKKRNLPNIFLVTTKSYVQVLINQLPHNAMHSMSGKHSHLPYGAAISAPSECLFSIFGIDQLDTECTMYCANNANR